MDKICEKCGKILWLMRTEEVPSEMNERYQTNPGKYCKVHRQTRAKLEDTLINKLKVWAFDDESDEAIIVDGENQYWNSGEALADLSRAEFGTFPRDSNSDS